MFPPTSDCFRDNQTTSDFESAHFRTPKQIVGAEFYDRSNFSRNVGLLGLGLTALVGGLCIGWGFIMFAFNSSGIVVASLGNGIEKEVLSLALNMVVSACTEAAGFVHGIALRSALASEKRLRFNTNLRLLSAASGWFNPNSTLLNIVMATLLILSYNSSFLLCLAADSGSDDSDLVVVSALALIVLGVALLLQAVIAFACVWAAWTKILTWSSSPFDLTAALIHHTQITPVSGRCMLSICDDVSLCPMTPSPIQPSAWRAHSNIKKVVMTLWALVVVCVAWGLVVAYVFDGDIAHMYKSWSFFPRFTFNILMLYIPVAHSAGVYLNWAFLYAIIAATQGPLTLALHCSELVVNVVRDERMWRKAMTKKGTTIASNPLAPVFGSPLNFGLLLAKPLLHWMFGLAVGLQFQGLEAEENLLGYIRLTMFPPQIINYAVALLIVSLICTTVVFLRPKGPQPAAYGHVQTLANLIDEFPSSGIMWWGDKGCKSAIRHAGTSEHRLPEVDMNALYA